MALDQFNRPEVRILLESALIPEGNWICPPPIRFSHETCQDLPFYFTLPLLCGEPNGRFPKGTKLLLVKQEEDGTFAYVADKQGLYVAIHSKGIGPL